MLTALVISLLFFTIAIFIPCDDTQSKKQEARDIAVIGTAIIISLLGLATIMEMKGWL